MRKMFSKNQIEAISYETAGLAISRDPFLNTFKQNQTNILLYGEAHCYDVYEELSDINIKVITLISYNPNTHHGVFFAELEGEGDQALVKIPFELNENTGYITFDFSNIWWYVDDAGFSTYTIDAPITASSRLIFLKKTGIQILDYEE